MTCIVGLIEGGAVFMGGDSAAFFDTELELRANQKVFRNGAFLMGCSGSPRVADALRYAFEPPKHSRGMDVARYMRTVFVDALRDVLRKAGVLHKKDDVESTDAHILVAYRARLFVIEDDFQVGETIDDFAAVGCGADVARGAMCVSDRVPARKRLMAALSAAERYNTGVRRPFYVHVLEAR